MGRNLREYRHCDWRKRNGCAGARGFTLIEILIVVVVLSIASAIVIPQISSHDDLDASSAARVVMSDLLYAQSRAIATQKMQYVSFDVSDQDYGIYSSMSPLTAVTHPVNLTDYVVHFGPTGSGAMKNVSLGSANFNGKAVVCFDELGVPYSYDAFASTQALGSDGTVSLTCGSNTVTLNISPDTGEITVN